jgi:hemolysin activation/secretion protein
MTRRHPTMHRLPVRLRHIGIICYMALLILLSFAAQTQTDTLHLLGAGQLKVPKPQQAAKLPAAAPPRATAPESHLGSFTLRKIVIDGASSASPAALQAAAAPAIGHEVNAADIGLIEERIGIAESQAGIALYTINIPVQKIRNGVLHFQVREGSVVHVEIQSATNPGKLQLIRAYAQRILNSRPLRQSVLERNILLMGDISGSKIGSKFIPNPAHPDQVTLLLAVQQTKFFGGFSLNNQGSPLLYNTQAVFNAGVNDLFHEGERTQLVLGLPLDIKRYQFYGINDIEPLGGNGVTLSFNAGELASHPEGDDLQSGTADFASAELNDPVIRSVHRNVNLGAGFDYLNSGNAFLGFTTSDERTRALHISLTYNDDKFQRGQPRLCLLKPGAGYPGRPPRQPGLWRARFHQGKPQTGPLSNSAGKFRPACFVRRTTHRQPPAALAGIRIWRVGLRPGILRGRTCGRRRRRRPRRIIACHLTSFSSPNAAGK